MSYIPGNDSKSGQIPYYFATLATREEFKVKAKEVLSQFEVDHSDRSVFDYFSKPYLKKEEGLVYEHNSYYEGNGYGEKGVIGYSVVELNIFERIARFFGAFKSTHLDQDARAALKEIEE